MKVTNEQLKLIQQTIEADLEREGYAPKEVQIIALSIAHLAKAFDEADAPVHNPLFIVALRMFANTLDLIHQLDKERK